MYIFVSKKFHRVVNWAGWASTSKIIVPAQKASFGRVVRLVYLVSNGPISKLYMPPLRYLIIAIVYKRKYIYKTKILSYPKNICCKKYFVVKNIVVKKQLFYNAIILYNEWLYRIMLHILNWNIKTREKKVNFSVKLKYQVL